MLFSYLAEHQKLFLVKFFFPTCCLWGKKEEEKRKTTKDSNFVKRSGWNTLFTKKEYFKLFWTFLNWVLRDSKIIFLPWNQIVLLRTRERKKHKQGMGEGNCLGCWEEKQVRGDLQGTAVKIFERRHFGLSHCFGVGACQSPSPPPKLLWKRRTVKALVGLDSVAVCEAPGETVQPVLCLEGCVVLLSVICHYLPGVMAPLCSAHNADNVACFPGWEMCWK